MEGEESWDEEEELAPARMAGMPRIMEDLEDKWIEEVHVGPSLELNTVNEIWGVLREHKDCFALSFADLERTPYTVFKICSGKGVSLLGA